MINIICEELQNDKDFTDSFSHEHTLLITGEGDPVEITRGRVIPQPDIFTSHEENNNIIIQQTFMAVEQGAECLSVMFDDTDVYILLLHYYNQKELNIPMFMESSVHRRQTTDITATAKEYANLLPNLLAAHGLSGCDTVTPCYGIGEMKILKTLKQGNHSLSCLGDSNANWPDVVKQATSFMLACYGVPKLNSMTQARANQWKTRVGRGSSTMPKLCFDILLCSETLVLNFRHIAELSIPGFKRPILLKRNEINRAQGMAVYIRSGCSASHKASFECGCHETQIIKVCGKHNNFYLVSVYRNTDADDGIFDCLLASMAAIQENDRKASFVFIGDFNAHHKEWLNSISQTDCHGLRALDFSSESGCDQIIHSPTHRSGNCLDLIFTDTPGAVAGNVGSPVGTSVHSYVSAIIKTEHAVPDISFSRKIYLKSQADWDGILSDLRELDWPDIYRQVDFVTSMNDGFERIIVRRIPSRVIKFCINDKAWFNEDCKWANLAKQEAYQLWRGNRSDITCNNYVNLRNSAQETYAAAEKEYNDGVRDTLIGTTNSHKWGSTLKTALFGVDVAVPPLLRPDGSLTHCPKEKAALFADVFDSKQSNDSLTMPQSCFPEAEMTTFAFRSGEVKKLLLELDPYGGAGPDGIFPLFFIKTANYLAPKISTVLRKLVRIGGFSMCWRVGNITPVPKSGSANSCPSDYRPITITPVLSKVFERLLAKRLNNFAEKKNLFPNLQFGFRKGLGTCDALLTITNFVQKALDCGSEVRMVGLDFSAAFDRVNHKALIFKLRQLGVGGPFLSILTEFLSNRLQRVVVDGQFNDYRGVVLGVPQGSVLGPLLFILYTHDMWFGLENMLVSYADDATLLARIPSPNMRSDVTESLNRDLSKISTWCNLWGMRLNPNKTQSMIVSRSRTVFPPHPDLLVGSTSLNSCEFF